MFNGGLQMEVGKFVKEIKLDDEKRIIVTLQESMMAYLQDPQIRSMLKQSAETALKENFKSLEIGKNNCRITVLEGSEDASKEIVETELVKGLEMAMAFMSQMGNK